MPAATVSLVASSISTKLPVARRREYASVNSGCESARRTRAMSLALSVRTPSSRCCVRTSEAPVQRGDARTDLASRVTNDEGSRRIERAIRQPAQVGLQLRADSRQLAGPHDHVAARDIDVVLEHDADACVQPGAIVRTVVRTQLADAGSPLRGQQHDLVANRDRSRLDATEIAPRQIRGRARDVLHRQAQRRAIERLLDFHRLEGLQQRGTVVPGEPLAAIDDHVAVERGHRHERHVVDARAASELAERGDDRIETLAAPVDEVHLVDRDDEMRDADELRDRGVPAGLLDDAVTRVDEQHGKLRRRRCGDHVPRVLLVSGRVGDDELAHGGREVAVRDVDRDALLALGGEAVGEQRKVERRAPPLRRALQRRELVGQDRLAVVEQPADQRALAVVDAPRGEEAQHAMLEDRGGIESRHQKYPWRLRSSIDASLVWSSSRVAPRSVIVVAAVSATIASSVSACEGTGAVQVMSPTVRKRTDTRSTRSPWRGGVSDVTGTSAPRRRTMSRSCAK